VGTLAARPGGTPEDVIGEDVPVRAGGQPAAVVAQGVRERRAGRGGGLASCVGPSGRGVSARAGSVPGESSLIAA
jgi:hypothetical protein